MRHCGVTDSNYAAGMGKGGSAELSYHRRRAAEEQRRSEHSAGIAAAKSHGELAAMHGERAERLTLLLEAFDEIIIATPA